MRPVAERQRIEQGAETEERDGGEVGIEQDADDQAEREREQQPQLSRAQGAIGRLVGQQQPQPVDAHLERGHGAPPRVFPSARAVAASTKSVEYAVSNPRPPSSPRPAAWASVTLTITRW